jgi:AraC-like DNA-binding protein/DNA gyrase inhibitor GyrI
MMDVRIANAFDLIKKRYSEKLSLSDIATAVQLSPYHFQRLFKKEMKESPAACLTRVRLERAAHLMVINPAISMTELAVDCGFNSLTDFSRSFTKRYGMSPSVFNNRVQLHHHQAEVMGGFDITVEYFPETTIIYNHTSIYDSELLKQFSEIVELCSRHKIKISGRRLGVLTHIAFHGPKDRPNYYAGIELTDALNNKFAEQQFVIPPGKYASFITDVSYNLFHQLMMNFKMRWLDSSGYMIKDIFAFEEILSVETKSGQEIIKRKIYVPVKQKEKIS